MQTTALTSKAYGGPEILEFETFELPALTARDARIEVRAAGVNPVDARRLTGELRYGEPPLFFGTEFAGVILELGSGYSGAWKVGDDVLGSGGGVTHATIVDVPVANLVPRPPSVTWEVAGSLAGAAQTAATILSELHPISSLLVHGGAGGVGSILIQLARRAGIEVVATGSEKSQDYIRSLGALPVVYGEGLTDRVAEAHPIAFDASIDLAGTEEATAVSLVRVRSEGMVASITATMPLSPRVRQIWRKLDPTMVEAVLSGVTNGELKWEVSASYPFVSAASAYAGIIDRHVRGKSVLTF